MAVPSSEESIVTRTIERFYGLLITAANSLQSPLLLIIRLYWGWQFAQTGWGKLHRLDKVAEFFTSLGIPLPAINAYFVTGLELIGGILLIVGLGSRLTALLLAVDMVVAFLTADREGLLSVFSDPEKFYAAAPYTFLFASVLILVFGPGRWSMDAWIASRRSKHSI